jgi:hypothetical protein|tara:strand:- start:672 stop:905 length:234 start_codon:yes stop_codon:yes gene_type:complete
VWVKINKMTTIEIKKALYKQKPMANLTMIRIGVAYYTTMLDGGAIVSFEIPISDMGSTDFFPTMEGKLLNRWIVNED